MAPCVSIIIPCYNVADYVDDCLDSLTRQTLRRLEIICVNDGSTDNTWQHLLRWREKDQRIILLNQPNAGVSAARNAGLDVAQGIYVGFVDPDDYTDPNMYARLFSEAVEYDADVVECGNHVFSASTAQLIKARKRSPTWNFEANASPFNFFQNSIWGKTDICVWNKIFRRSMMKRHHLRFNVTLRQGGEDEAFRLTAIPHASRLLFIPDCLYYYRLMRNGSLSQSRESCPYAGFLQEFKKIMHITDYWKERGWLNSGLFSYGVRKLRPFFVSKCPLFHRIMPAQKQDVLEKWSEFYRHAEGEKFQSSLSERDRQFVELLTSVQPPANEWERIFLLLGSWLPGPKGRYYSCKKTLSEYFPKN